MSIFPFSCVYVSAPAGFRMMIRSGPFAADGQTEFATADPLTIQENPIRFLVCDLKLCSCLAK